MCPSDAARIVGGEDWRPLMPLARAVAADLAVDGLVRIQQKGNDIDLDETPIGDIRGPIRLAPGPSLRR